MSFPRAWTRLPGPADFIDAIIEDLTDGSIVLAGLPEKVIEGIGVEVAESASRKGLGRWATVRSTEAHARTPKESIERRAIRRDESALVVWVDATEESATETWIEYAQHIAASSDKPRICIAMSMERAEEYREEKGLRRRLWRDFVTATDSRVLTERFYRDHECTPMYIALKGALIAEIAGPDLFYAEQLARERLGKLIEADDRLHERVWAAQLSILLPLVEKERRRLLEYYREHWRLPHTRKDETEIQYLEDMEIGDMAAQAQKFAGALKSEQRRLDWLRRVRNALAHSEIVRWGTLTSNIALQIADFREPRQP